MLIVREREPMVYTSTSSEWSAVGIILAAAIMALLGFMLYYFAVMHAARVDDIPATPPIAIQQPVTMPTLIPQPVLIPTPSAIPQPGPSTPTSLDGQPLQNSANENTRQ